MRIIGIELRAKYQHPKWGSQQQEIAVIPCDIEVVMADADDFLRYGSGYAYFNGTLHTTQGDIQIPDFVNQIGLHDHDRGLKFRSR